jgi:hypothetical protein
LLVGCECQQKECYQYVIKDFLVVDGSSFVNRSKYGFRHQILGIILVPGMMTEIVGGSIGLKFELRRTSGINKVIQC